MAYLTRIFVIPLFAVSMLAYGAQRPVSPVGKWKMKSVSLSVKAPETELAKAKAAMMKFTLEFSKDKGFVMMVGQPMKGTWKLKGREISLSVTEMMGKKMAEYREMARKVYADNPTPRTKAMLDELGKPMVGTLSADGKTLTMNPPANKAGFVFTKA